MKCPSGSLKWKRLIWYLFVFFSIAINPATFKVIPCTLTSHSSMSNPGIHPVSCFCLFLPSDLTQQSLPIVTEYVTLAESIVKLLPVTEALLFSLHLLHNCGESEKLILVEVCSCLVLFLSKDSSSHQACTKECIQWLILPFEAKERHGRIRKTFTTKRYGSHSKCSFE